MIKFGVTSRERARRILPREEAHLGWWPYDLSLLEEVEQAYSAGDEPLLERLYQSISAGEGVWKITKANRFLELDERLEGELEERSWRGQPLVVHDMAASSGVTSLEWYERLAQSRPVTFIASDYFDHLTLVTPPRSEWTVVFDVEDHPLQCVSRAFVISCRRREMWRHLINRAIQWQLDRRIVPAASRQLAAARQQTTDVTELEGIRQVSLFHPRCLQQARSDESFQLKQHNLFTPDPHHCDVVRVMNALTPHHFNEQQLESAVRNAVDQLPLGGLFLLGRSIDEEDGRTAATLYERTEFHLQPVWDMNEGSEIKSLVNAMTLPSPNLVAKSQP